MTEHFWNNRGPRSVRLLWLKTPMCIFIMLRAHYVLALGSMGLIQQTLMNNALMIVIRLFNDQKRLQRQITLPNKIN
jgi:hypothetical protein